MWTYIAVAARQYDVDLNWGCSYWGFGLRERARARDCELFDIRAVNRRYQDLYERLIN